MSMPSDAAPVGASETAQPQIQMYPRFLVVPDNETLKLKEEKSNTTVKNIGGKDYKLFKREVTGVSTWFRVADEYHEHGKICFAKEVSPETQEFSLQHLLHKMDEAIMDSNLDDEDSDDDAENVSGRVKAFVRKQAIDRTIFSYDPSSKKGDVCASDNRKGRTVFYVTVGQIKQTRITIKSALQAQPTAEQAADFSRVEIDGKQVHIPNSVSARLRQNLQEILDKRFADKTRGENFLKDIIDDFDLKTDQDFGLLEEDNPATIAHVMDCLVVLARNAKDNRAAIIIPDYMTSSGNSKLIENALDFVEFNGPVICYLSTLRAASASSESCGGPAAGGGCH